MTTTTRSGAARRGLAKHLTEPLVVGDPDLSGPLAVYPLLGPTASQRFVALSQADGEVTIGEVASASVRDLAVTNTGKIPVLLYEGQEVLGGQQNRSVDSAILVPPGVEKSVPVSCVEAGRWDHHSHRARFVGSPHSPSPRLRRSKSDRVRASLAAGDAGYADQGEVWSLVDSISAQLHTSSRTRSLSDAYEARDAELREVTDSIELHDGQLGVLVTIGGEFCVLDFVGRPDVFAALHDPLLRGYALEALASPDAAKAESSIDDARRSVDAVMGASGDERPSRGLGTDVRFTRQGISGSALVNDGELVQLTAFPVAGRGTRRTETPPASIRRPSRRPSRRRAE